MKTFKIKARFVFNGTFTVKADDEEQARKMINDDTGLVMGGNIHTNCNDEDIDWNFDTHSDKDIIDVQEVRTKLMTKKEFKERCDFHVYQAPGKRVNAIFYDWKQANSNSFGGYKYRVSTDTQNCGKEELFGYLYQWVMSNGEAQLPYFVQYRYADTDKERFKIPIGGL